MKGRGFIKTFPSIYVPSVINRFNVGYGVRIYFIMQSLIKKKKKKKKMNNLPCFESAVRHLVYFVNSRGDSYANKYYEISFLWIHFVVNSNTPCLHSQW